MGVMCPLKHILVMYAELFCAESVHESEWLKVESTTEGCRSQVTVLSWLNEAHQLQMSDLH